MRWQIRVDHIGDGPEGTNLNAVGVEGPGDLTPDQAMPYQFKIYDDDENLYYEGVCSDISRDPADDFGIPNAGAPHIEYLVDNQWQRI